MSWMTDHAQAMRHAALERRNRGFHTGTAAKGWNVKRSDPEPESWDYVRAVIKARLRDHWALPGWRHMTAAQRYNARKDAIFERARMQGHLGFSPITNRELAERRAGNPLRPDAPQKPCDVGLFSDDAAQLDLVDQARKD